MIHTMVCFRAAFCCIFACIILILSCSSARAKSQSQSLHSSDNVKPSYEAERALPFFKSTGSLNPEQVPATFDTVYNKSLGPGVNEFVFSFSYQELANETTAVRVNVTCVKPDRQFPVLFVIKQQRGIMSWQVPLVLEDIYDFPTVSRTLCPLENHVKKARLAKRDFTMQNQTFFVDVSTVSEQTVNFSLVATLVKNFIVKLNETQVVSVSPSSPKYYKFEFPHGVESVVVQFTSDDDVCAIMSIQTVNCPVFDLDNNVEFGKAYQSMTKKAALTVLREDFDVPEFYVVFVVKPTDYECTGIAQKIRPPREDSSIRTKTVEFTIQETIPANMYWQAILVPVAFFLMFYVVTAIVMLIGYVRDRNREPGLLEQEETESDPLLAPPVVIASTSPNVPFAGASQSYGTTSESAVAAFNSDMVNGRPRRETLGSDASSIDEADVDSLSDAEELKEIYRTKTFLYVADLSRKGRRVLASKYKLYHRNLITIAIFYGLPVVQLVLTYQKVLNMTGNEDICYYNFFCSHPLGLLSAFNNVFSNVGYVMLGILFLLITYRRDYLHKKEIQRDSELEKKYGIPQHFGLFYAMGLALIMEGILSGCYHVCPSYSNFQFDTSFMYIIAGLCMLKIYQIRHPDINATAHSSYFFFAWIILFGVIGVVYGHGSIVFWIIIAVIHISACLVLSAQIYYMGRWQIDRHIFKRTYVLIRTECCSRPMYMDRMILLVIGNAANWSLAIIGCTMQPRDVSSFISAIFICNLVLYTTFYIVMKLRNKEKIPLLTLFFILLATVVWGFALYFFMQRLTTWQLSPAESREGNKQCMLLGFYDGHDIWHFLSATALFFSFMILMTLDDALHRTPRDKIPVF